MKSRSVGAFLALLAVATTAVAIVDASPASALIITEHTLDNAHALPHAIVSGADADLWFTEPGASALGIVTWDDRGGFRLKETHVPGTPTGIAVLSSKGNSDVWYTDPAADAIGHYGRSSIPVGPDFAAPSAITPGPDGNLWFTDAVGGRIGKVTPVGVFTSCPPYSGSPDTLAIVSGADGNLWFGESTDIGKVDPSTCDITTYALPQGASDVTAMTVGPDGKTWFVTAHGGIGRIDNPTNGSVTIRFQISDDDLEGIISTPDHHLWITDSSASTIVQVSLGGAMTTFATPTPNSHPLGLSLGQDGNIWVVESATAANALAQVPATTSSAITEFPTADEDAQPTDVALGADGNVWFTESGAGLIGRVKPDGSMSEFDAGIMSRPTAITNGPDSNLWFVDESGPGHIGKMSTDGSLLHLYNAANDPIDITVGPDGNLWYIATHALCSITPGGMDQGCVSVSDQIQAIATGSDGALWVAADHRVDRYTTDGVRTRYDLPDNGRVAGITADPDGSLWLAGEDRRGAGIVYALTTAGGYTSFPIGGPEGHGIAFGPDGNLWITQSNPDPRGTSRITMMTVSGSVTTFTGLPAGSEPLGITAGADGNLWFADAARGTSAVGRIAIPSPTDQVALASPPFFAPNAVAVGSDGDVWFTDELSGLIGRVGADGTVKQEIPAGGDDNPVAITVDPGGLVWFGERGDQNTGDAFVGSIDDSGSVSLFPVPGGYGITSIASSTTGYIWICTSNGLVGYVPPGGGTFKSVASIGHDLEGIADSGNGMWFTDATDSAIWTVTKQGLGDEHATETPNAGPAGIVLGPDRKHMWFTERSANKVVQVLVKKPGNLKDETPLTTSNSQPLGITAGADGNVWVTEFAANALAQVTPKGAVTELAAPGSAGLPEGIAAGTDGSLWVADAGQDTIDHVATDQSAVLGATDSGFSSNTILIPTLGGTAFWSFGAGNKFSHTVSGDTGVGTFDSGLRDPGGSFQNAYEMAGYFSFSDGEGHDGSVGVPVRADPPCGDKGSQIIITWGETKAPDGYGYFVQVQSPKSGWKYWFRNETDGSKPFTPKDVGTYHFRAELRSIGESPDKFGRWSPVLAVSVPCHQG